MKRKEIIRELKEKDGVTSMRYAAIVARLVIHKIKNKTITTTLKTDELRSAIQRLKK